MAKRTTKRTFVNKSPHTYKVDQRAKPEFSSRAERDAYYSQRTLERQRSQSGFNVGSAVSVARPAGGLDDQTIEVPDSLIAMFRLLAWSFRQFERIGRLIVTVLALMMGTILAGILLGILSA